MLNVEIWLWALSGIFAVAGTLVTVVWALLREEAKAQAELIKSKADQVRLSDAETRWKEDHNRMREDNEKMRDKLEERHLREITQMETRLTTEMRELQKTVVSSNNSTNELIRDLIKEMAK
jgi:uncharacterized membrane protein YhiD involved in acid resistance